MGTYFLDTSAIIKRYILEQGQAWVLSLCDPAHDHVLYISQAACVETVATICRRAREQSITLSERDRLINTFRRDSQLLFSIRYCRRLEHREPKQASTNRVYRTIASH